MHIHAYKKKGLFKYELHFIQIDGVVILRHYINIKRIHMEVDNMSVQKILPLYTKLPLSLSDTRSKQKNQTVIYDSADARAHHRPFITDVKKKKNSCAVINKTHLIYTALLYIIYSEERKTQSRKCHTRASARSAVYMATRYSLRNTIYIYKYITCR